MRVQVLYFASAREAAGCSSETLEVAEGATVADVKAALSARRPAVGAGWSSVRIAVGARFAADSERVHDGDRVALIPPVSGG